VKNKRILILANIDVSIYNTRRELVQLLIEKGYEVYISCLYGERVEKLKDIGCKYIQTNLSFVISGSTKSSLARGLI
jgi:galacturonosyltransferase